MREFWKRIVLVGALALASAPIAPVPAFATNTVLLACGEDSCLQGSASYSTSTIQTVTTAGTYRSGWGRESLFIANGSSTGDPPSYYWLSPIFTATGGNLWIHAEFIVGSTTNTANQQAIRVYSPDGVARIVVRESGTAGTIKVSTANAARTFTDLGTASTTYSAATLTTLDLNINYTCSGSGGVTLYLNGSSVMSFSGNPCTDSATTLNRVAFASLTSSGAGTTCTSGGDTCWTEIS